MTQQNMPRPIDSTTSHSLQSKYTCLHQMCTFDILVRFHGYQTDRYSLEFGGKLRCSVLSVASLGVSRSVTLLSNYEAFNTPHGSACTTLLRTVLLTPKYITCSQAPTTGPYPAPDEYHPHLHISIYTYDSVYLFSSRFVGIARVSWSHVLPDFITLIIFGEQIRR